MPINEHTKILSLWKKQLLQLEEGSKYTLLLIYAINNSHVKDCG
jgi:hypothetical protein